MPKKKSKVEETRFNMVVPAADLERYRTAAHKADMTMSAWVRTVLKAALGGSKRAR